MAMPGGQKHECDDALAHGLASGFTLAEAASAARVSVSTVTRRLRDEGFRAKVNLLKQEMWGRATSRVTGLAAVAGDRLQVLLDSADERVRLAAVNTALTHGLRLKEAGDLEQRLSALEQAQKRWEGRKT